MEAEEPLDKIGLFMMRQAPRLLGPGRMDAVATTILLLKQVNFKVFSSTLKSLDDSSCRIDARLVSDLYKACPPRLKPALASTFASSLLDPEDFHAIFEDAYARKMTAIERRDLASTLDSWLRKNREEVSRYRALIVELMRSRQLEPCLIGIALAQFIPDLGQKELELLDRKLSARYSPHRQQVLWLLYKFMRQHQTVAPQVLSFCASEHVIGKIRMLRREDPEPDVRVYARQALAAYEKLPQVRRAKRTKRKRVSRVQAG